MSAMRATSASVLLTLGLPADRLVLESQSRNTADSAARVVPLLGGRPFALVTSAGHLPRSMATFAKAGLRPVPVPADYRLPGRLSIGQLHARAARLAGLGSGGARIPRPGLVPA